MKVLYAASECVPFAKTGGLGDVTGALPKALCKDGLDVRVIMPLYEDIPAAYRNNMLFMGSTSVPLGWRMQYAGLFELQMDGVIYYFVDNEFYFKRKGLYGFFDDGERFAFFSKAIPELMRMTGFYPDVLHVSDWQTALAPLMLNCYYRDIREYANIKTVLAIHNIEFQGRMSPFVLGDVFGLPASHYSVAEYKNDANMLKAGIESADRVITVSPTYAEEILSPFYAYGLEDILNARRYKLSGIVNGIDTDIFNPKTDGALFRRYGVSDFEKKADNKAGLQGLLGLPLSNNPLIGMVGRLSSQKGIDLVQYVADEILSMDLQMVILGTGEWKYENALREIASRYPGKLSVIVNFSTDMASKIYGASDMFLMPSKFEPCGLSQMIAMRYGSIPIVRETGGLKDTVEPFNPTRLSGTGFTFKTYDAYDMLDAIRRGVGTYANKTEWNALVKNAMSRDYSWDVSAKKYEDLYESITR